MAELTTHIPDDLHARLRSHVTERGEDLADFVTRAVQEQLAYEDDAQLQAATTASVKRGLTDAEAGRVQDARQAMREIAAEKGIGLKR
jgi:predicted transcriptional regulator